jgi:hypothetical protein
MNATSDDPSDGDEGLVSDIAVCEFCGMDAMRLGRCLQCGESKSRPKRKRDRDPGEEED